MYKPYYYEPTEEKFNIISHAFGMVLSVIGLIFLCLRAFEVGGIRHIVSFAVFGLSMVILYAASTLYHWSQDPKTRWRWNVIDRAAIYILIAGSYTPFTLVTLQGSTGWWLFAGVWGIALAGVTVKFASSKTYEILSTVSYIIMGWLGIFAINPLIEMLPSSGLLWLTIGGVCYMIGAVFYLLEKVRFNHAIFHVFVLLGSASHFVSVYNYVV